MSEQKTTKGKLKLNKVTKNDLITYLMVVTAYVIVEILLKTGNLSSLLQGLLVPLCTYVIFGSFPEPDSWYFGRTEPWTCRLYVYRCIQQCTFFTGTEGQHCK